MNRWFRSITFALVMVAVLMTGAGCKKLWPWGKKDKIDTSYKGGATPPTELVTPESVTSGNPDGWTDTGKSLPARDGEIVPVTDARLDGCVVYFAFDSYAVGDAERPKLETLAQSLKENATWAVRVEGHCDERGSDEYNRGLGERRAIAVRDYLVNLGIEDSRIDTISFGEEKPAAANASDESGHAANRRAEFVVGVRQGTP